MLIYSADDLAELVRQYGFLPLLKSAVPGFSVEEHTPPEFWFSDTADGPWEWKGPSIQKADCAYGRFFAGKTGFIAREWFPDFANFRRGGLDFEDRWAEGLVRHEDKKVYDALGDDALISKAWRGAAGIANRGAFDAIVNRLQMQGYVITVDFEYAVDKTGKPYGWGLARYARPEAHWGDDFARRVYERDPEVSGSRVEAYLTELLPRATPRQIRSILGNPG